MNNINKGSFGENIAAKYLIKKGFSILKQNVRFGKLGEIDLIAKYKDEIVFVEVKTRNNNRLFGEPYEAVDEKKQRKLKKMADIYLQGLNQDKNLRFDIVEILYKNKEDKMKILDVNHIEDAFY
jgi:putative endonuclease